MRKDVYLDEGAGENETFLDWADKQTKEGLHGPINHGKEFNVRMCKLEGAMEEEKKGEEGTKYVQDLVPAALLAKFGIKKEIVTEVLRNHLSEEFDIFHLETLTLGNELPILTMQMFFESDLFEPNKIDPKTFRRYMEAVQGRYRPITYHNKTHGADVAHFCYQVAVRYGLSDVIDVTKFDLACLVIGGAVHDLEHFGFKSNFLVTTRHPWALRFNDQSVLENHHVATAFELMRDPTLNIFEHQTWEQFQ